MATENTTAQESAPVATVATDAPAQAQDSAPAGDAELAAAVAEHAAELNEVVGVKQDGEPQPAETEKPAEEAPAEATDSAKDGEAQADGEKPAEVEAKPEEAKPAEEEKPAEDAVATSIAKYVRQHEKAVAREREARATAERLNKERADFERERAELGKARDVVANLAKLVNESPIDAIEHLLGTDALVSEESTLVADLLARIQNRRSGAPVRTEEDRIAEATRRAIEQDRATREREQQEAAKREAEQKRTAVQKTKEAFFQGLAEQFETNADKYPFLQARPVPTAEIDGWLQQQHATTGRIPDPAAILAHFEKVREDEATSVLAILEKTGKLPARNATTVRTPSATAKNPSAAAPTGVDTRGAVLRSNKPRSLEDEREEIARRLDQMSH